MNSHRTQIPGSPCRRVGALFLNIVVAFALLLFPSVDLGNAEEGQQGRLTNTFASVEEIAAKVLILLSKDGFERLEKMRMTEEEFKTIIWPELPRAVTEPSCGKLCNWCWRDLNQKNIMSLMVTLKRYGGEKLRDHEFLRLHFAGETTQYETYKVHRDVFVVMRDQAGEEKNIKLFGTVIEMDGRFKLMGFVVKY